MTASGANMRRLFYLYATLMGGTLLSLSAAIAPFDFDQPLNPTNSRLAIGPLFQNSHALSPETSGVGKSDGSQASVFLVRPERQNWVDAHWPLQGRAKETLRLADLNLGIHTASKSSPAIDPTGVYVGSDTGALTALDFEGRRRWRFQVKGAAEGIHSSPAVDARAVYFGAYNGRLYALNKQTGEPIWARSLGGYIGSSPAFLRDSLLISVEAKATMDGYVVRLDRATGEVLWSSPYLGEQAHSSPAVAADIQTAVVGSNNGYLTALNTETGAFLWRVLLAGPIKATPLIYENVAYATSWDGEIVAAALESGAVIWKQTLPGGSMSTPVPIPSLNMIIVGGRDGHWWAFHTKSGKQLWHRHWVVDDPQISTPLAMSFGSQRKNWRVWLTCGIHRLCLLDAATGKVVSDLAMGARLTGTPVAYGRRLWLALGSQGPLLGLDWTQNNTARP